MTTNASITGSDKVYDGFLSATGSTFGGDITGELNGDSVALDTSGMTLAFDNAHVGTGTTISSTNDAVMGAITGGGVSSKDGTAGNAVAGLITDYAITTHTGVATVTQAITKAPLTINGLTALNKTYDGNDDVVIILNNSTIEGLVGDETLMFSDPAAKFDTANVGGSKAVTVTYTGLSDAGTGSTAGLANNYSLATPTVVNAAITAKTLTITGMTASNKTYDGNNSVVTLNNGTIDGLVPGETLIFANQEGTFDNANAGNNKLVTVTGTALYAGSLSTAGIASNYVLTQPTVANATIITKALTVNAGNEAFSKNYDGTDSVVITLNNSAIGGLVGLETLTFSNSLAKFSTVNAGASKVVTITYASLTDAGIGSTAGSVSNYNLAQSTDVTANIIEAPLTIIGMTASDKTYNGDESVATLNNGTIEGLVGGETLTFANQVGTFDNANAGNSKAVTVTGTSLVNGTGLADNYILTQPTIANAAITKAALTITGMVANGKIYDGGVEASLTGGSIDTGIIGEALTFSGQTGAFLDKNVASSITVTVTNTVLGDGAGGLASNYSLMAQPTVANAAITTKDLTMVGVTAVDKIYNGNKDVDIILNSSTLIGLIGQETLTFSDTNAQFVSANVGEEVSVTISNTSLSDAGTGNTAGLINNYSFTELSGVTAKITHKPLTITGMAASDKIYDGGVNATLTGGVIDTGITGEALTFSGQTGVFFDKNAADSVVVTVSNVTLGNGAGGLFSNYSLTAQPVVENAGITTKILSITGMTADDKPYDGSVNATLVGGSVDTGINGEYLEITGQEGAFIDKNVAESIGVIVSNTELVDDPNSGGGLASNYSLTQPTDLSADIEPAVLVMTGYEAVDKIYDGTTSAELINLDTETEGLVAGETLTFAHPSATFSAAEAGTFKALTITNAMLKDGTGSASNYILSAATVNLNATITRKPLTITGMTASDKTYNGGVVATLTGGSIATGVGVEKLTFSGQTGEFVDKNAASGIVVTVDNATLGNGSGGLATNYILIQPTDVTGVISAKALTLTSGTVDSKIYNGSNIATISAGVLDGLVGTETLTLSGSGTFESKNVGLAKDVTADAITLVDAGSGTTAGLANNYSITNFMPTAAPLTGNITAKALTITGMVASNKTYDGSVVATLTAGSIDTGIADEALNFTGQVGAFVDKNVATGKAVTVTNTNLVDGIGGLASNYSLTQPIVTAANISAKNLTVSGIISETKVYDGGTTSTLNTSAQVLEGLVIGDTVTVDTTGTFADKNVANGKTLTLTSVASGTDAGNYNFTYQVNTTANITTKAVTVIGVVGANRTQNTSLVAGISGGVITRGASTSEDNKFYTGDNVILNTSNARGIFADQNAGINKAITVTGLFLEGADAFNYTLTDVSGVTGNIFTTKNYSPIDNYSQANNYSQSDLYGDTVKYSVTDKYSLANTFDETDQYSDINNFTRAFITNQTDSDSDREWDKDRDKELLTQ